MTFSFGKHLPNTALGRQRSGNISKRPFTLNRVSKYPPFKHDGYLTKSGEVKTKLKHPRFFTSLKCNKRGNSNNIYMEKRNSTLPQLHNQVKRNLTKIRPI